MFMGGIGTGSPGCCTKVGVLTPQLSAAVPYPGSRVGTFYRALKQFTTGALSDVTNLNKVAQTLKLRHYGALQIYIINQMKPG